MKTLFYKNNRVVIEEVPVPGIGANEILVQTAYSLISTGSELFAIAESSAGAKAGKKENQSIEPAFFFSRAVFFIGNLE